MAVITISRQFGAGGLTLARQLADILGYAFVDQEIIDLISKEAKVSKDWVETIEKEAGGKFHQFINRLMPKGGVDRIIDNRQGYIDESIYRNLLQKVIAHIADKGNCVILGRGGQFILKDRKNVLHVLLIADKAYRVRFMETHYKLLHTRAQQVIDAEDKRRINLYRKFDHTDYDQPSHYHFTLNMSKLTLELSVQLIRKMVTEFGV